MMTAEDIKIVPEDVTLEKAYFIRVLIHRKSTGQGTRCAMPLSVCVSCGEIDFFHICQFVNFTNGHDRNKKTTITTMEMNAGN
jgi:hypothetical protein